MTSIDFQHQRFLRRRLTASFLVVITTAAVLAWVAPAHAQVSNTSRQMSGSATNQQEKEWFDHRFDFGIPNLGKIQGRVRFVTVTRATLSSTRTIEVFGAGPYQPEEDVVAVVANEEVGSHLAVTARPALQILFEWQDKKVEPYECSMDTFPTMPAGEFFLRLDAGGTGGVCGAIEVTADDLNWIFTQLGIDLELPEVFQVLDRRFTARLNGVESLVQSHQIFQIRLCKIISNLFSIPLLGDNCDIEFNAEVSAPLRHLHRRVRAQACAGTTLPSGHALTCEARLGEPQTLTYDQSSSALFSAPGLACATTSRRYDLDVQEVQWAAQIDDVAVGLSLDFNIKLAAEGEGTDVITVPLGSVSLLDQPMALTVGYAATPFTLGIGELEATPDTAAPTVAPAQVLVTVSEGSPVTLSAVGTGPDGRFDNCDPEGGSLDYLWRFGNLATAAGPNADVRFYETPPTFKFGDHNARLRVTDAAGNVTISPFSVVVTNVAPAVTLARTPLVVRTGQPVEVSAQSSDPGVVDHHTFHWSFGDGETLSVIAGTDRQSTATHTYARPCLCRITVEVDDGEATASTQSPEVAVVASDSFLSGSGTFTADAQAVGVPAGAEYRVSASVGYRSGNVPEGLFDVSAAGLLKMTATAFDWLVSADERSILQGDADVDGSDAAWRFRAEITGSSSFTTATVALWRPGVTTLAAPDYLIGGGLHHGRLVTR